MTQGKTCQFRRCDGFNTILEGMELVKKEMESKGLLTDKTTFEEMADYAGKHVIITEKKD